MAPSRQQSAENTSTMSSFHPEFESTQQFDTATQEMQLPNLRSSAQRFNYYNPPRSAMPTDTSYVRDGFPDFTEKSPSPEASRSIELARGAKGSPNPKNLDLSDISLPQDSLYDLNSTPPQKARPTPNRKTENLRKEASLRRAHSSDKKANAAQRRSLSDMHHKVHRESESSFVGDDRPATQTINPRNTRFTSAQLPSSYSRDQGLQSQNTPQRPLNNNTVTWTGNQTQASFLLPDLPNITELVSGVRKDGTPVFSRSAKSRSRFTSSPQNNNNNNNSNYPTITNTLTHAKINSMAVPDDEKAIFASLQLLRDKVANLESDKSEAQKRIEEYESEVSHLRSRVDMEQKLRRPDSAMGDDEEPSAKEKWRLERATLQSTIRTLQDRLGRGDRKLSVNDMAVKRLTQERDDLFTQLGVAYYNSEEVKSENSQLHSANEHLQADNAALQSENERLRARLAQIKAQFNDETQQWSLRESDLKSKIKRREAAVQELQDTTTRSAKSPAPRYQEDEQLSSKRRSSGRLGQSTKHNILDSIENELRTSRSAAAAAAAANNVRARSRSKSNTRKTTAEARNHVYDDDISDVDSTTNLDFSRPVRHETREDDADTRDITYLSFLDPNELAKLRKTLEEERRAAKQGRPASAPPTEHNDTIADTIPVTRKSSLREINKEDTARFTIKSQVDENTGLLKNVRIQSPHMSDAISYSEPREATEASMLSTSSRRRNRTKSIEEMTSAFILPDITLHVRTAVSGHDATLHDHNAELSHNKANCTICPSTNPNQTKDITVPQPIPVSERNIDDTNATIRPSQPPPVALATVLKQLEDEVTHLKLQLSTFQTAYNAHDPALGRRKRRAVKSKIEILTAEVERRSDQIYALYDVVEGQKTEPEAVDEEQVEETLQSLGIDREEIAERVNKGGKVWGLDGVEESEDDMPWDGFSEEEESEVGEVVLPKRKSSLRGVGC